LSSQRFLRLHLGEMVSAYLDGELTLSERRRAESHLAGCDVCRDELTDMMFVRARLRALPMLELPTELTPRSATVAPIHRRVRVLVSAAAAAVALVVAVAALVSPGDVVALSGNDFSMTYRARASLDQNQTGRLVPLENLFGDDSGVNG
jgi:anti-sigma factor RsiW